MFRKIPLMEKTIFKSTNDISAKDILICRHGIGLGRLYCALFDPHEHIGLMCFPKVAKNNSRRRSQQMNYECFISTMAELMKKYADK